MIIETQASYKAEVGSLLGVGKVGGGAGGRGVVEVCGGEGRLLS